MAQSLVLAFGFGQLAMLGWLVAAAAPLVIHLLNRRKHREVEWAAMEWLLAALRKNAKRVRLEQWLLLAVRTLIIVCIVLAFADPYLKSAGFQLAAGQRSHKVFVLDGSFSMGAISNEKSHFDRARDSIARIVEQSPEGDAFTLVLLSNPPRAIVATPAFDKGDFLDELNSLKLPHASMDLPATLARVEEILNRTRSEHPRLTQQQVLFFTDLQRAGWVPEIHATQATAFRRCAERISRLAQLHVVDVAGQSTENIAVTSLRWNDSRATIQRELIAEVELHNFGEQERSQGVELWIDGRQVASEQIRLGRGEDAMALFPFRFDAPGEHVCEVRAPGDDLPIDNFRWLAVSVRDAVRVLCVDGKPSGTFGQATDYLTVALAPQGDAEHTQVRPDVIRESSLIETDLADYDCLFLCNVGQFTAAEARMISDFVAAGGGVVFFLGDQVQPDSYNRFLGGEEPGIDRLLPAKIGEVAPEGDYRIDPLGYQHALLSLFRDQEQSGLLNTPIRRYQRLTTEPDSGAKVAMGLSSGDPIVVEESIGNGHVVLVATSADVSWSVMPMLPSYVPLVHELLTLAMSGRNSDRNILVGQPLIGDQGQTPPASIETPSGERHAVRLQSGETAWQFSDTLQSGVYWAHFDDAEAPRPYAVNVDTSESNLAKLTNDELRNDLWPGVPIELSTSWQDTENDLEIKATGGGKANLPLLYLALGLLLTEPLMAWYFGYGRK